MGFSIGLVDAIAGLFKWEVSLTGFPNHAGTTPMHMRNDAFQAVIEFSSQIQRVLDENGGERSVATILYWKRTNATGAAMAMILGTACGLYSYFEIGFYVAALLGALVSMSVVLISTLLWPQDFSWGELNNPQFNTGDNT